MASDGDFAQPNVGFNGLSEKEVIASRQTHGSNRIETRKQGIGDFLKQIILEPMLLLLLAATVLYFVTSQTGEAMFMLAAIVLTSSISLYQTHRSAKALEALNALTDPVSKVVRNGVQLGIPSDDLVVGDVIIIEEGSPIPADATVVRSNDLSVNESILTG